jgi:hypothetical protein
MVRWFRLVLAVLALVGVMAARPGGAVAAKGAHHHHHCMGMMDDQNCPGDDQGSVPACCVAAVCAMVQPSFSEQDSVLTPLGFTQITMPMLDDVWRSSVRPPPDLRPPIA